MPAGLKYAIDYLFHEWRGKPGAVISYGGHGGDKAGPHLLQILRALRMLPVEKRVELTVPRAVIEGFDRDGVLSLEMEKSCVARWDEGEAGESIAALLRGLAALLDGGSSGGR